MANVIAPLLKMIGKMQNDLERKPITADYGQAELAEIKRYKQYVEWHEMDLYNELIEYFENWIKYQIKNFNDAED